MVDNVNKEIYQLLNGAKSIQDEQSKKIKKSKKKSKKKSEEKGNQISDKNDLRRLNLTLSALVDALSGIKRKEYQKSIQSIVSASGHILSILNNEMGKSKKNRIEIPDPHLPELEPDESSSQTGNLIMEFFNKFKVTILWNSVLMIIGLSFFIFPIIFQIAIVQFTLISNYFFVSCVLSVSLNILGLVLNVEDMKTYEYTIFGFLLCFNCILIGYITLSIIPIFFP